MDVVVLQGSHEVEGARVTIVAGPALDVWSARCQEANADTNCETETTDARGQARFYASGPVQSASIDVSIGNVRRSFGLQDGATRAVVDWNAWRPGAQAQSSQRHSL